MGLVISTLLPLSLSTLVNMFQRVNLWLPTLTPTQLEDSVTRINDKIYRRIRPYVSGERRREVVFLEDYYITYGRLRPEE